jgi:hypothetical protein
MVANLAHFEWSVKFPVRQITAPLIAFGMGGLVGQHALNSVAMELSLVFECKSSLPNMVAKNAKEIQQKIGAAKSDPAPLMESGACGLNGENAVSNVDQAALRAVVQLKSSHSLVVCLWKAQNRRRKIAAMVLALLLVRSPIGLSQVLAV